MFSNDKFMDGEWKGVFDYAIEVLGDPDKVHMYFNTPSIALGGKKPIDCPASDVRAELNRIEHGIIS